MGELKYNFGGIEGAASASFDDGNVDSFASTGGAGSDGTATLGQLTQLSGGMGGMQQIGQMAQQGSQSIQQMAQQGQQGAQSTGGAGRDLLVGGRGADNIDAGAGKAEFDEFTIVKTTDGTLSDGTPGDLVGTGGGDAGSGDDYFSQTSEPAGNSSGYEGTHILYQDVVVPAASEPKPYLQYKLDTVFVKSWSGSAEQDAFDFKAIDGGAARSSGGAAGGVVSEGQGYGLFIGAVTASSGDAFDFKAMESGEAASADTTDQDFALVIYNANRDACIGDACNGGNGGILFGNGGDGAGGNGGAGGWLFGDGGNGFSDPGPQSSLVLTLQGDRLDPASSSTGWFRYQTVDPSNDDRFMTKPVDTSAAATSTPIKIYIAPSDPTLPSSTDDDYFVFQASEPTASEGGTTVVPPIGTYQAMLDQANVDVDNDVVTLNSGSASNDGLPNVPVVDLQLNQQFDISAGGHTYFDGEFLTAHDLTREQVYLSDTGFDLV